MSRHQEEIYESSTKCYHKKNIWESVITTGYDVELKARSHALLIKPHRAFEPQVEAPHDKRKLSLAKLD